MNKVVKGHQHLQLGKALVKLQVLHHILQVVACDNRLHGSEHKNHDWNQKNLLTEACATPCVPDPAKYHTQSGKEKYNQRVDVALNKVQPNRE